MNRVKDGKMRRKEMENKSEVVMGVWLKDGRFYSNSDDGWMVDEGRESFIVS